IDWGPNGAAAILPFPGVCLISKRSHLRIQKFNRDIAILAGVIVAHAPRCPSIKEMNIPLGKPKIDNFRLALIPHDHLAVLQNNARSNLTKMRSVSIWIP